MKNITRQREARTWTRATLGSLANIHPSRIGSIELGRVIPYPVELKRIAKVLRWRGDPERLLEEVDDHAG